MEHLDQHWVLHKCSANLGFGDEEDDGAGRMMKFVCGLMDVFTGGLELSLPTSACQCLAEM